MGGNKGLLSLTPLRSRKTTESQWNKPVKYLRRCAGLCGCSLRVMGLSTALLFAVFAVKLFIVNEVSLDFAVMQSEQLIAVSKPDGIDHIQTPNPTIDNYKKRKNKNEKLYSKPEKLPIFSSSMPSSIMKPSVFSADRPFEIPFRPHIIVIIADDLGYNDIGYMNVEEKLGFVRGAQTPTLDALAAEGVILTQHYAQTVCSPTRGAFMTGRYPINNGLEGLCAPRTSIHLSLSHSLLPELLSNTSMRLFPELLMTKNKTTTPVNPAPIPNPNSNSNSMFTDELLKQLMDPSPELDLTRPPPLNESMRVYHTSLVGKWHLGYHHYSVTPTFRGFDSFLGFYSGAAGYFDHKQQKVYDFHLAEQPQCGVNCSRVVYEASHKYSTSLFHKRALEVVRNYSEHLITTEERRENPLFLVLSEQATHSPLQVPNYLFPRYFGVKQMNESNNFTRAERKKLSERTQFAGLMAAVDEGVTKLVNTLHKRNMLNDTMFVFFSDNGAARWTPDKCGGSNAPLRGAKHSLFEGGTRTVSFLTFPRNWGIPRTDQSDQTGIENSLKFAKHQECDARPKFNKEYISYDGLFHVVDWFPTLLDAAGFNSSEMPVRIDGISHLQSMILKYAGISHSDPSLSSKKKIKNDSTIMLDQNMNNNNNNNNMNDDSMSITNDTTNLTGRPITIIDPSLIGFDYPRKHLFYGHNNPVGSVGNGQYMAFRNERYKIIIGNGGNPESWMNEAWKQIDVFANGTQLSLNHSNHGKYGPSVGSRLLFDLWKDPCERYNLYDANTNLYQTLHKQMVSVINERRYPKPIKRLSSISCDTPHFKSGDRIPYCVSI